MAPVPLIRSTLSSRDQKTASPHWPEVGTGSGSVGSGWVGSGSVGSGWVGSGCAPQAARLSSMASSPLPRFTRSVNSETIRHKAVI